MMIFPCGNFCIEVSHSRFTDRWKACLILCWFPFLNSEVNQNDRHGWMWLLFGFQVPGLLPDADQPRRGFQLLPCHRRLLLLFLGHQGQSSFISRNQEEGQPLYTQDKCQAEGGIPEKETLCTWTRVWRESDWTWCSCDQCDNIAAPEKGQHIRMKHGKLQLVTLQQSSLASPESLRETVSYSEALMNSIPKSPITESCSKRQSKQETKCDICKIDLNTHEEFKNHNRMIHKFPEFPF